MWSVGFCVEREVGLSSSTWSSSQAPKHLYIHWPFCASRCSYCDFVALENHDQFFERYQDALCRELDQFADRFDKPLQLRTCYIGGGTPSLWPLPMLKEFFDRLHERVTFQSGDSVTLPSDLRGVSLRRLDPLGANARGGSPPGYHPGRVYPKGSPVGRGVMPSGLRGARAQPWTQVPKGSSRWSGDNAL